MTLESHEKIAMQLLSKSQTNWYTRQRVKELILEALQLDEKGIKPQAQVESQADRYNRLLNEENRREQEAAYKKLADTIEDKRKEDENLEERKKYPHEFGGMSDLCIHCGTGYGWLGSKVGKPCNERYRMRMGTVISYKENLQLDKSYTVTMDAAGHKWYVKNDKTPTTGKLVNIGTIDVVLHLTEWPEGVKKMQFRTLDGNLLPSGTYHARIVDVRVVKP
jgi:hypothetical protein